MFQAKASLLRRLTYKYTGRDLTDLQVARFCSFGELLLEWNRRLNLTRITDPEEVILKHFVDSMVLAKFISGEKFVDLGTGAGFPGIPLKILQPDLEMVLVDSLQKRLKFLDVVIETLQLAHLRTVHARLEDFGGDPLYRSAFTAASSRAVARLPVLLEYALPVLKREGLFLAPKGAQFETELTEAQKALSVLGGSVEAIEHFNLGKMAEHRIVLVIKKIKDTPAQYPRSAGRPAKDPLV